MVTSTSAIFVIEKSESIVKQLFLKSQMRIEFFAVSTKMTALTFIPPSSDTEPTAP